MKIFSQSKAIREHINFNQANNDTIALVATMGHLHAGHVSLIQLAKTKATWVVVSIFINPIQFNQASDYERYPRTLEEDLKILRELEVDIVFTPSENELYPHGPTFAPKITIPELSTCFEGQFRSGHFDGVCTIVCKLFNIIAPNVAVFGLKDYQQYLIIQQMVEALNFSIDIITGETQREANGLAMSSRNAQLTHDERQIASQIYRILKLTKEQFLIENISKLEANGHSTLKNHGFDVEYFSICDAANLKPVSQATENIAVLTAVWLGNTRLIDNILFPPH